LDRSTIEFSASAIERKIEVEDEFAAPYDGLEAVAVVFLAMHYVTCFVTDIDIQLA